MRKSIAITGVVLMAALLAGCSSGTATKPYTSNQMTVLGTSESTGTSPTVEPTDPAAVEHIPTSQRVLVHATQGTAAINAAKAIQIARGAAVTKGAKSVAAIHVLLASDISRPSDPQGKSASQSVWMVTFHKVQLPAGGPAGGQIGSSTVFVNADTGKVVKTINYVPVEN
jgi:hypothetical protein